MSELQRQLTRNIWTSWVGYLVRIGVSFVFVPYITSVLGDARYGVWVITFQTVNYFALLDFGLEKALLRFVSRHLSQKNFARINQTLHTAFGLYLVAGSIIILGVWLTATFLFGLFQTDDPLLSNEGRQALIIIGLYAGTRFYLLPFAGCLGGYQRHDISNGLSMLEDFGRAALMIWLLANGYGLVTLALAILGASLVRQLVAMIVVKRVHPETKYGLRQFDRTAARELYQYSKITFGISLAWMIIFNTDIVLLGLISSSAAAGIYAPGAQLMLYLRNVINVIAAPITTTASHLEAQGDSEGIARLYVKGVRYAAYLSFAMAVGVILYARPFIALWLTPEFGQAAGVLQILAISTAFFVPQMIGNAILFGIDRHQLLLKVLIAEATAKIVLSLILIKPYGLVGMAVAAAAPQLLIYATWYPFMIARELRVSPVGVVFTVLQSGLLAMFLSIPVAVLLRIVLPPNDWPSFAANVTLVLIPIIAGGYFVLEKADREKVASRLFRRSR